MWEYCTKSELHPVFARLTVLKGRQKGVRARETKRVLELALCRPFRAGRCVRTCFLGLKPQAESFHPSGAARTFTAFLLTPKKFIKISSNF